MKVHQTAFAVLLTVSAFLAIFGGQYALLQHFEHRRTTSAPAGRSEFAPFQIAGDPEFDESGEQMPFPLSPEDRFACDTPVERPFVHVPQNSGPILGRPGEIQNTSGDADAPTAKIESRSESAENGGPVLGKTPEQLPRVDDAEPISESQKRRDVLTKSIIAEELPSASQEERDVWFDELKGLEPSMTRELLRLRAKIRHDSPPGISEFPQLPPIPGGTIASPTVPLPELVSRPEYHGGAPQFLNPAIESSIPAIESSIAALRIARDVVLNNIANAQTTAFRRSRILFEDLAYQQIKLPGQQDAQGKLSALGVAVGFGVQVAGTALDLSPGQLERTNGKLNLAIVGDGLFQIQDGSQILYTRSGAFSKNADGELVLTSAERGRQLEPTIAIPTDATEIVISGSGLVSVQQPGATALVQVGKIQLAHFVNPDGLIPRGENLFAQSDASGSPLLGEPGTEARGTLKQGFLETSNVNLEEELAEARRLQSRIQALEQVRAILGEAIPNEPSPAARIAETPAH